MPEMQLHIFERSGSGRSQEERCTSMPQRELCGFIDSVGHLMGAGAVAFLTEVWLDELASMDARLSPTSPDWRLVSLGASARLACRIMDLRLSDFCAL